MSFDKLLEDSKSSYDAMLAKYKEQTTKQFKNDDDRMWYPESDKAGNGSAIIRFLPNKDIDKAPWVQVFQHAWKGPTGSWLIENCPTTLNGKCPICERNNVLWNEGERGQTLARKQKRNVYYYSNVYVLKDPGNKENEGQVKIFRYGQKIYKMLMSKLFPEFDDVAKIDPFHFMKGCDFRLRFKKGESGFRNYDHSTFDEPSPFLGGKKAAIKEVYDAMYSLDEFVDPANFKSYDELLQRLLLVNGESSQKTERIPEEAPRLVEAKEPVSKTAPADDDPPFDLDDTESTDFDAFFDELKD